MGIQDRDYYREDYAQKNGKRYDKRTATYRAAGDVLRTAVQAAEQSNASSWYDPKQYRAKRQSMSDGPPDLPVANWPWPYQLIAFLVLIFATFGLYKFVSTLKVGQKSSYTQTQVPAAESPRQPRSDPHQQVERRDQQLEQRRIDEQRAKEARAKELAAAQKREAEWNRFYQPSASCAANPATVDCANEYIRARRAFDARNN
ncbi:hypothetical protein [Diaphorobacter sp.]|uniref:hypothetical protein n=1 Tax=Diaphorobacter sp. TaxID=1934310 RepID=UPI003D14EAC8